MAEEKVLKFTWKIENYAFCWKKTNECLQSSNFDMNVPDGSSWCMKIFPRGVSSYENYVGARLERLATSKGTLGITIDYEISLLRSDDTAEYVMEAKNQTFRNGDSFGFDNLAFRQDILESKKSILLPKDILTVQCLIFPKGTQLKCNTQIIEKTRLELKRTVFFWKSLGKISNIMFKDQYLHFNRKNLVRLELYYNSNHFRIRFVNLIPNIQLIRCKIGILDSNNLVSRILMDKQIEINDMIDLILISGDELMKRKVLYLPNDKLTLHGDLTCYYGRHHSQIESVSHSNVFTLVTDSDKISSELSTSSKRHQHSCADNNASLKIDFQNLYQKGTHCDLTLKVGNENMHVHKAVLVARSPFFKDHFARKVQKNGKKSFTISDLDADTVRHMLKYMYTNSIQDLDCEMARNLCIAAYRYGPMELARICSDFLKQNLCVENVAEVLILANMHTIEGLKICALNFIGDNKVKVMSSTEWKAFMSDHTELAAEIMHSIMLKKDRNSY